MNPLPIVYVDVFTSRPLLGNPVAVVFDAAPLSTETMQQLARFTNLSETTFVTQAQGNAYHARIFTPRAELPFAGHPTLGTAWALLEAQRLEAQGGKVVQHCGIGAVELQVQDTLLFTHVPVRGLSLLPSNELDGVGVGLGLEVPQRIDVGPTWLVARCATGEQALLACSPSLPTIVDLEQKHGAAGVTLYSTDGPHVVVRSFAPGSGITEDPVCGSGNGAVAAHLRNTGWLGGKRQYQARQGRCVGRAGEVTVRFDDEERIFVGGHCVTVVRGELEL